jgi:crotonobetainyl-CoA:carnitine CoA-transferase CaiB-like acyl-CoA transferase
VEAWTVTMGKTELFHGGQRRDVPIGESMRPSDVVRDVHLRNRGYVVPATHAAIGDVEVPGPPYLYSETPWRLRRPAPLLGQHTDELLHEAGFSPDDVSHLRSRGVTA